jgi:hypothetical protein
MMMIKIKKTYVIYSVIVLACISIVLHSALSTMFPEVTISVACDDIESLDEIIMNLGSESVNVTSKIKNDSSYNFNITSDGVMSFEIDYAGVHYIINDNYYLTPGMSGKYTISLNNKVAKGSWKNVPKT